MHATIHRAGSRHPRGRFNPHDYRRSPGNVRGRPAHRRVGRNACRAGRATKLLGGQLDRRGWGRVARARDALRRQQRWGESSIRARRPVRRSRKLAGPLKLGVQSFHGPDGEAGEGVASDVPHGEILVSSCVRSLGAQSTTNGFACRFICSARGGRRSARLSRPSPRFHHPRQPGPKSRSMSAFICA